MSSFKASRKGGGNAQSRKGSPVEVQNTVIKVKKGADQVSDPSFASPVSSPPKQHKPAPAVIPERPSDDEGLHVVRQYVQPMNKRHIGGRRLSVYVLIVLSLTAVCLVLSYFSPWGLLGLEKPFEPGVNVNFSLLRRFPYTNISLPEQGAIIREPTVQIAGFIKPGINLYLNNRPISYDKTGFFSTEYILQTGENIFVLEARLGHRKKSVTRTVTYDPREEGEEGYIPLSTPISDPVTSENTEAASEDTGRSLYLQLYAQPESTWVETVEDGVFSERRTLLPRTPMYFTAADRIIVRVGNGSSVAVKLNGVDLGPVGSSSGEAEKEYTLDSLTN
ncbi:hypothetical protein AUK40_04800 [Candidatus Wirthbacteria bacterium CG2_30_54_11]|uniref:DUF4115 domain-containing protein n=1 Tax=Candidatus Wirthbacteria bacterium CG2_30_54_11 TaxID=1817892 RepID=A0A1J5IWC4_9BACT|nr:MAG: hypothetical protein AUK40_04800 [Candidatus Wirthbacteria bacterium CG2_30_54_11]